MSAQYVEGGAGDVTYVQVIKDGKSYYGAMLNDIEKKMLVKICGFGGDY